MLCDTLSQCVCWQLGEGGHVFKEGERILSSLKNKSWSGLGVQSREMEKAQRWPESNHSPAVEPSY